MASRPLPRAWRVARSAGRECGNCRAESRLGRTDTPRTRSQILSGATKQLYWAPCHASPPCLRLSLEGLAAAYVAGSLFAREANRAPAGRGRGALSAALSAVPRTSCPSPAEKTLVAPFPTPICHAGLWTYCSRTNRRLHDVGANERQVGLKAKHSHPSPHITNPPAPPQPAPLCSPHEPPPGQASKVRRLLIGTLKVGGGISLVMGGLLGAMTTHSETARGEQYPHSMHIFPPSFCLLRRSTHTPPLLLPPPATAAALADLLLPPHPTRSSRWRLLPDLAGAAQHGDTHCLQLHRRLADW